MIKNTKENCINDIASSFRRTARWRLELQSKYVNDPRNGRAAERLEQLADEASGLTDEAWAELSPHYSWCSGTWNDAVSLASRHVEFRSVKTFAAFINDLLCILAEQNVAA
jgi:hypothetical protein